MTEATRYGHRRFLRTRGGMEMTADTRWRTDHTGARRFSEGIEQLPDTRGKRLTGRFSRGIERSPDTPEKRVTRRFSHGIEQLPDTPEKRAPGRFSQGIEQLPDTPERPPGPRVLPVDRRARVRPEHPRF